MGIIHATNTYRNPQNQQDETDAETQLGRPMGSNIDNQHVDSVGMHCTISALSRDICKSKKLNNQMLNPCASFYRLSGPFAYSNCGLLQNN